MAVYLKVTVTARIKIQDPCNNIDVLECKEDTHLHCPHELVEEDYKFEVEDAD